MVLEEKDYNFVTNTGSTKFAVRNFDRSIQI